MGVETYQANRSRPATEFHANRATGQPSRLAERRYQSGELRQLQKSMDGSAQALQLHAVGQRANTGRQVRQLQTARDMANRGHAGRAGAGRDGVLQLKPQTVQRYADAAGGGKISDGGRLLLRGPQAAYAIPQEFVAANQLAGQVQFNQGAAAAAPYQALHQIVPVARQVLADQTAGYDVQAGAAGIREHAKRNYYPDADRITSDVMDAIEQKFGEDWDGNAEIEAMFGTTDRFEIEEQFGPLAELIAARLPTFGNYDESGIDQRITQYMAQQVLNAGQPLMPSDCGVMARNVAGHGNSSEAPAIAPGNVYGKPGNPENPEGAQWNAHFAAIIMADGADHLTMENAGAKASEGHGKAQFDKTWFFEMYGNAHGQSFADKYNQDLGYE